MAFQILLIVGDAKLTLKVSLILNVEDIVFALKVYGIF